MRCILGFYLLLNLKAVGGMGDSGTLTMAISEEQSGTGVQQLAEAIIRSLKSSALSPWHAEFRSQQPGRWRGAWEVTDPVPWHHGPWCEGFGSEELPVCVGRRLTKCREASYSTGKRGWWAEGESWAVLSF